MRDLPRTPYREQIELGGGPAGLNAALVLGRARRNVILFDNNKPRNAVTQKSLLPEME